MVPLWAAIAAEIATVLARRWVYVTRGARLVVVVRRPETHEPGDRGHRYTSTYCVHGLCDVPGRRGPCRRHCKTCAASCLCPCHAIETDVPKETTDVP
jgi:hypothetical protein